MPREAAFTYQGIEYRAFPDFGCFFGIGTYKGRQYVSYVAMNADGTPDAKGSTARNLEDENQTVERPLVYNTGEVTNCDEDQSFVDAINEEFGTKFTMAHFPGR